MKKIIEFPVRPRARGENETFELIVNWLIEAITDIAELRSRVEELEAERSPEREATPLSGRQKEDVYGEI